MVDRQNAPEIVNQDPHGEAWFIKVQLADRGQIDGLMTSDQYEAYLAGSQSAEVTV